jgi:hypothetical protein
MGPINKFSGHIQADETFIGGKARNMSTNAPTKYTNSLENFWSLLKRTLGGAYVSVEPYNLFRYLDELGYRFNSRYLTDGQRFDMAPRQIAGRRLTWDQFEGKIEALENPPSVD